MQNVPIIFESSNCCCAATGRTDIGGRDEQQDDALVILDKNRAMAVLCDGMGGCNNGRLASRTIVEAFRHAYEEYKNSDENEPNFLYRAMMQANTKLLAILGRDNGGSTLSAIIIRDHLLFWVSVGDSRIYILRSGEMLQVTRDHNYFLLLSEQLECGKITEDEYYSRAKDGDALISYMGKKQLLLYDLTRTGFRLLPGDLIILMSDGLYKALEDFQIKETLINNDSMTAVVEEMIQKRDAALPVLNQDNSTFILIKYL